MLSGCCRVPVANGLCARFHCLAFRFAACLTQQQCIIRQVVRDIDVVGSPLGLGNGQRSFEERFRLSVSVLFPINYAQVEQVDGGVGMIWSQDFLVCFSTEALDTLPIFFVSGTIS